VPQESKKTNGQKRDMGKKSSFLPAYFREKMGHFIKK
jgi:hypothetical protein